MTNEISIDRARVRKVVEVAVKATAQEVRGLHPVEAIIGFAEILGRAIATQEVTETAHQELIKIACNHVIDTVKASYIAKGKNASAFTI